MFKVAAIFFISLINFDLCGQNNSNYFLANSFAVNSEVGNEKILDSLLSFDSYFFGEQHDVEGIGKKEVDILKLILSKKKIGYVFLESPTIFYKRYSDLFHINIKDTSRKAFEYYSVYDKSDEEILRYLYDYNSNISKEKIKVVPIDMVDFSLISKKDILNYFKGKKKTKKIKADLKIAKRFSQSPSSSEADLIQNIISFRTRFYDNSGGYRKLLDDKFDELKVILDGMYAYIEAKKEKPICDCISTKRENYMYRVIAEEINKNNKNNNFISINGVQHISLKKQKKWGSAKDWTSLANIFKEANFSKKVCSIYFLDREKDILGEELFPDYRKAILDYFKPGTTYIIKLDSENTPFINLTDKFQYIVVW